VTSNDCASAAGLEPQAVRVPARRLLLISLLLWPACSLAATPDCSEDIAFIDARLAGQPDDHRRAGVLPMRETLVTHCALMDAAARQRVRDVVARFYPEDPEAARKQRELAEQIAQTQAEADLADAVPGPALPPPNTDVYSSVAPAKSLSALARGRSLYAQRIHRDEDMHQLTIEDWDLHDGRLRVLYSTSPSLQQFGRDDWQRYLYVVEADADGGAEQRLVTSRQASDQEAVALRRGTDEVLYLRRDQRPNQPLDVERWSVAQGERIAAVTDVDLRFTVGDRRYSSARLAAPIGDGNFLFTAGYSAPGDHDGARRAWFKLSADARLLASTEMPDLGDQVSPWTWLPDRLGRVRLVAHVSERDDRGLDSGELADLDTGAFPASVRPVVSSEKRLFRIDRAGRLDWMSPALERKMSFEPVAPAGNASAADNKVRMNAQQEARWTAETRYRVGWHLATLNVGHRRVEMIRAVDDGYLALIGNAVDRRLEPPQRGQYVVHLNDQGVAARHYLEPFADANDLRFTALEPDADGEGYYLLARTRKGQAYVLRFDDSATPRSQIPVDSTQFDMQQTLLVADGAGLWLFGFYWHDDVRRQLLYVQRLQLP